MGKIIVHGWYWNQAFVKRVQGSYDRQLSNLIIFTLAMGFLSGFTLAMGILPSADIDHCQSVSSAPIDHMAEESTWSDDR